MLLRFGWEEGKPVVTFFLVSQLLYGIFPNLQDVQKKWGDKMDEDEKRCEGARTED